MRQTTINVLGTDYAIREMERAQDAYLNTCDGYCDKTSHTIVVVARDSDCEVDDFEVYQNQCLRHEIIHAFLYESGLHNNWKHDTWGHDETCVDWIAIQFPKIAKVFEELKIL